MADRERLIELLGRLEYQYTQSHSIMTENVADYLIQKGVTVQQWIPVTERLPEKSGEYLVINYTGHSDVLSYSARHKAFNAFDMLMYADCAIRCTHWMPLPEPPKGVE